MDVTFITGGADAYYDSMQEWYHHEHVHYLLHCRCTLVLGHNNAGVESYLGLRLQEPMCSLQQRTPYAGTSFHVLMKWPDFLVGFVNAKPIMSSRLLFRQFVPLKWYSMYIQST